MELRAWKTGWPKISVDIALGCITVSCAAHRKDMVETKQRRDIRVNTDRFKYTYQQRSREPRPSETYKTNSFQYLRNTEQHI